MPSPSSPIRRHRTAIHRQDYSRPVRLALEAGWLWPGLIFYDFGSGRSVDAALLQRHGLQAGGWDPFFQAEASCPGDARKRGPRCHADVVNLGYVLNVIEDPQERAETLRVAFELARVMLIVAVRVGAKPRGLPFGDGVLTSAGTFQKIYSRTEFRDYLVDTLVDVPRWTATFPDPGIAFVVRKAGASR